MNPDDMQAPVVPDRKIESLHEKEELLVDTRRDPFGLLGLYLLTAFGVIGGLGLTFFLIGDVVDGTGTSASSARSAVSIFALVAVILVAIFLLLATYIYRANRLIVSSLNVTQVNQLGLFNRKVSELSLANVEDVTAQQKGLFATLFGYGTLTVETAGEQNNFIFPFCPRPNGVAQVILQTRDKYIAEHKTEWINYSENGLSRAVSNRDCTLTF